ncbi:MAG TPA: ABC transporter permease [Candidatus Deferrimicrobium sp.]|nr:ABC transporter permease [Candidatus Deferrimicrobium sp.]
MSRRRVVALFRRVAAEIRRDRPSLGILFIAPILLTGLVSFILRESQAPTVTADIVNGAGPGGTVLAGALHTALVDGGATVIDVPDEAAARSDVEHGRASLAIILPADPTTGLTVVTLGLDAPGESAQIGAVQKSVQGAIASITGAPARPITHETIYGRPTDDPVASFAPAIVGFFAYFFVYVLTGVSFLRERTGGTLERLLATPVTRAEIVTGYTLGFGLFATVQVIVLLLWALGTVDVPAIGPLPAFSIGLGIPAVGSPILAFLVVLLLAIGAVSLGIFLSTFARTELQVIQFIPLVLAPQFLLSGVIFPVSSLPAVLQPLVGFMPLNYAVDGLRQVFIRGADLGVGALQLDLAILAAIGVFFGVVASLTIRRDVV